MVVTKKGLKRGTAGELHGLEGGPATQEVAADNGIFLRKPAQHVREVVLEGTGQTVRHTHLIADEAAGRDALFQRAHLRTLRLERFQLVAMLEQELELACSVRGIILGAAGGASREIPREGERIDGEQDKELVGTQRGDNRPPVERKTYGNGVAAEALTQGTDPGVDCFRGMVEDTDERTRSCGCEDMLESIVCSGLQTRNPWVHVLPPLTATCQGCALSLKAG